MPNTFKITTLAYDENDDVLTAEFYLLRSCIALSSEPDADAEDSLEKFRVTAEFCNRRFNITDVTDHAGDVEQSYAPFVLYSFMSAWEHAYAACTEPSASPADVTLDTFDVNVEIAA